MSLYIRLFWSEFHDCHAAFACLGGICGWVMGLCGFNVCNVRLGMVFGAWGGGPWRDGSSIWRVGAFDFFFWGGGWIDGRCVQSLEFDVCSPRLPNFILLVSFSDTSFVVSILDSFDNFLLHMQNHTLEFYTCLRKQ